MSVYVWMSAWGAALCAYAWLGSIYAALYISVCAFIYGCACVFVCILVYDLFVYLFVFFVLYLFLVLFVFISIFVVVICRIFESLSFSVCFI